ncbi:MAG: endo-1,4-beta-xylanase [Fimbriimonas sp.]
MSSAILLLALASQIPLFSSSGTGWSPTGLQLTAEAPTLRLTSPEAGPNPWSSSAHKKTEGALAAGDVVSFSARMRSPNRAKIGIMFEQASPPNTKYIASVVIPPSTWQEYRFAGMVARDLAAGEAQVALFMGYGAGTVEIQDIKLENLGKVDLAKIPQTIDYYGASENSPAWRKEALARIEKFRKGDLTIRLLDKNGRPIRGAKVTVEQTRHNFRFGTAAPAARLVGTTPEDLRFQETVRRLYNTVTFENDLKWNALENQDYSKVDQALAWMKKNGIEARGHNLVWGAQRWLPAGLWQKSDDEVRRLVEQRVRGTATRFAGKVYLWDVVNEAVTETALWDRIGWRTFSDVFKWARESDPKALLAYNDYNITEENEAGPGHRNRAKQRLDLLVKDGAPFDVIGIQAHVGVPMTPMKRVLQILDEMGSYGKQLEITEYDLGVVNDDVNGQHMDDFLTACFSHPKVGAFIMWGFWEGSHWRAAQGGAMIRKDWSWRPAAKVWEELTKKRWWTRATKLTDNNGSIKLRAFKGEYNVKVNGEVIGGTGPTGDSTVLTYNMNR